MGRGRQSECCPGELSLSSSPVTDSPRRDGSRQLKYHRRQVSEAPSSGQGAAARREILPHEGDGEKCQGNYFSILLV